MARTFLTEWDNEVNAYVVASAESEAKTFLTNEDYEQIDERLDALEENGPQGGDSITPSVKVEETVLGVFITVTDKDGTTTATVYNGKDGVGIEEITIQEMQ